MKYTINGKEYTELDINKRCAELLGVPVSFSRLPEKIFKLSVNSGGFTDEYNPCNNPQDTWPIVEKCWGYLFDSMLLKNVHGFELQQSRWNQIMINHKCTSLAAACICLIEENEA